MFNITGTLNKYLAEISKVANIRINIFIYIMTKKENVSIHYDEKTNQSSKLI